MPIDPFTDRLARVRERFAASLTGKIDATIDALPRLSDGAAEGAAAVAEAYRCVHGIVGVGRAVGFPASGSAARDAEDVLRPPQQQHRGLTPDELTRATRTLQLLRAVAARELQSFHSLRSQTG